jgi:hypothetical protein
MAARTTGDAQSAMARAAFEPAVPPEAWKPQRKTPEGGTMTNGRSVFLYLALALVAGCSANAAREVAMSPSERFAAILDPGANPTPEQASEAAYDCFKVGDPAAQHEKLLKQAHGKQTAGKLTAYWFYPGKAQGQEGDFGVSVGIRDDRVTDVSAGIVIQ